MLLLRRLPYGRRKADVKRIHTRRAALKRGRRLPNRDLHSDMQAPVGSEHYTGDCDYVARRRLEMCAA